MVDGARFFLPTLTLQFLTPRPPLFPPDIRNTTRKIVVGDRVYVDMGVGSGSSQRAVTGVVRYTGAVHFASGFWVGVELDVARGTNDGSVNGTRYFACRNQHGIFAAPSRVIK